MMAFLTILYVLEFMFFSVILKGIDLFCIAALVEIFDQPNCFDW